MLGLAVALKGYKMQTISLPATKRSQSGFSLIELIIALGVMIIILGATVSLMRSSLLSASGDYEATQVQQELRFSQEYIARDLLSAGDGIAGAQKVWLRRQFVINYLSQQDWPTSAIWRREANARSPFRSRRRAITRISSMSA